MTIPIRAGDVVTILAFDGVFEHLFRAGRRATECGTVCRSILSH